LSSPLNSTMVSFTRLGFDIRQPVLESGISADACAWPQATLAYESALSSGFAENSFQLLDVPSADELVRLDEIVRSSEPTAVIVELAVFEAVAAAQIARLGGAAPNPFSIAESAIAAQDFDACDLDGFFSAFYMGIASLRRKPAAHDGGMLEACIAAQAANLLVPSHAPFVTVRVRVLRRL